MTNDAQALERYFKLMKSFPALFKTNPTDGIRLITDADEIRKAKKILSRQTQEKGLPLERAMIGVVSEDQYIYLIRDAIQYRDGSLGTYIRIVHAGEDFGGIAVLPKTDAGFVLVRHFRHATRQWHWEIPRGFASSNDPGKVVIDELIEEIGATVLRMARLGSYYPDSGLLSSQVHIYQADIELGDATDRKEAISDVSIFQWEQLKKMTQTGEINDGFTLAAMTYVSSKAQTGDQF